MFLLPFALYVFFAAPSEVLLKAWNFKNHDDSPGIIELRERDIDFFTLPWLRRVEVRSISPMDGRVISFPLSFDGFSAKKCIESCNVTVIDGAVEIELPGEWKFIAEKKWILKIEF